MCAAVAITVCMYAAAVAVCTMQAGTNPALG